MLLAEFNEVCQMSTGTGANFGKGMAQFDRG